MHSDPTPSPSSPPIPADWPELQRQRRAIVVVDVVESVRLMQANEADVIDRWRRFVNEVRTQVLPQHGGRLVKSLGDGLLLEFESVQVALKVAWEMHRIVPSYNLGRRPDEMLSLRIGAHACDVVIDGLDVYGHGVNLASRLATLAAPGGMVASPEFTESAVAGLDAEFDDLGEVYLKHFAEPVHAIRVRDRSEDEAAPALPAAPPFARHAPCIAVLPLVGPEDRRGPDVVGELVADGIIGRLAASAMVSVVSRMSSTPLARRGYSMRKLGTLLGCDYLASGRWFRAGRSVVLTIELAGCESGVTLWAERLSVEVKELLQPDDAVTAHLADQCLLHVIEHRLGQVSNRPMPSLHAHSLQLLGLSLMHRSPVKDFLRAGEVFEHLIDRHPTASQPRAWLAQWHVMRVTRSIGKDLRAEGGRALEQTRRALEADPQSALALAVEGFVQCHIVKDLDAAQHRLDLAVQIKPSEPLAWLFRCVVAGFRGNGDSAWEAAERAVSLSPLDPMRPYFDALASSAALSVGKLDRAIELAERALRANRQHLPTLRALTIAQAERGDIDAAKASAQRILQIEPGFSIKAYVDDAPRGADASRERYAAALALAGVAAS